MDLIPLVLQIAATALLALRGAVIVLCHKPPAAVAGVTHLAAASVAGGLCWVFPAA